MNTKTVQALSEFIRSHAKTPFSWGEFDCCIFSAKAVEIQTGIDLYEKYRGTYSTESESKKSLEKNGAIADLLNAHFQEKPVTAKSRGDVVMLTGGIMGIYWSGNVWTTTANGVRPVVGEIISVWGIS